MSSKQQKKDERMHLEMFRELIDGSPVRLLSHDDNPDFLVEREGRTIGIEHTEFFRRRNRTSRRPYGPAELEGIQQGIIRKAMELYTKQGNSPVSVKIWFDPGMKFTKLAPGRSEAIAVELSSFIAEWARTDPSPYAGFGPDDAIPIKEIGILSITRDCWVWSKENPALVGSPSVSQLQGIIAEKDTKYDIYRQKCDECWLLITANRFNPAQGTDLTQGDDCLRHCYTSRFGCIFFLEVGHRELFRLNRTPPNNASVPIK
jgi:hypothetical protein